MADRKAVVGDVIEVEWLDTYHHGGWHDEHETREKLGGSLLLRSVGYLVESTANYLAIAQDKADNGGAKWGELQQFPTGVVTRVTLLVPANAPSA